MTGHLSYLLMIDPSITISVVGIGLALLLFIINRKNKSDYEKTIKRSIKKTMQEVNVIFQQVYMFSNDYDYDSEMPTRRITGFMRTSAIKIHNYSFIITHNSSLINLSDDESKNIDVFLAMVDWFVENYTFSDNPLPKQISNWKMNHREDLGKNATKVEEISDIF